MRINDLRSMSVEALRTKRDQLALDLSIEKRKIASTGVQSKKVKAKELRRTMAQILTLLKEKGVKG
jgi:ribosomal protein L29